MNNDNHVDQNIETESLKIQIGRDGGKHSLSNIWQKMRPVILLATGFLLVLISIGIGFGIHLSKKGQAVANFHGSQGLFVLHSMYHGIHIPTKYIEHFFHHFSIN